MIELTLSEIWTYPIKSLRGISFTESNVTEKGLEYDRRWMLVDDGGNFITQRQHAKLVFFNVTIYGQILSVSYENDVILFSLVPNNEDHMICKVWNSNVVVQKAKKEISDWFSDKLGFRCHLVFMPEANYRKVEDPHSQQISLADAYPILVIGQSSLDDLNDRMLEPLPMNRFRPNLVFTGGKPYEEDEWKDFIIRDTSFRGTRASYRCIVTTTNQETGIRGREPLLTLSKYRRNGDKIFFGQNVLVIGPGSIKVGDRITLH